MKGSKVAMKEAKVPKADHTIPENRRVQGKRKGNRAEVSNWSSEDRLSDMHRMLVEFEQTLTGLERKVDALLRDRFLDFEDLDAYHRVQARRFPAYSQHEEDGLLVALIREAGAETRYFVEVGCGTNGGNCGLLAAELGWRGLMVDEAAHCIAATRERFGDTRAEIVEWSVDPKNVDELFRSHDVPENVDVMSLDIDSFDYWVLENLTAATPRILICEYNSTFGPDMAVTIPYDRNFDRRDLTGLNRSYFGCSLAALDHVMRTKGYGLFGTDPSGANAIFLRDDVARHLPRTTPSEAFRFMPKHKRILQKMGGDAGSYFEQAGLPLVHVGP